MKVSTSHDAMTRPPLVNTELTSENPTQSIVRYEKKHSHFIKIKDTLERRRSTVVREIKGGQHPLLLPLPSSPNFDQTSIHFEDFDFFQKRSNLLSFCDEFRKAIKNEDHF